MPSGSSRSSLFGVVARIQLILKLFVDVDDDVARNARLLTDLFPFLEELAGSHSVVFMHH